VTPNLKIGDRGYYDSFSDFFCGRVTTFTSIYCENIGQKRDERKLMRAENIFSSQVSS
jgi:hypothetical protein